MTSYCIPFLPMNSAIFWISPLLSSAGHQPTQKLRGLSLRGRDFVKAKLKTDTYDSLEEKIGICLREITADLLAVRMVGISYLFAFNEFFKTLSSCPGPLVNERSAYPGFGLRLSLIFEELETEAAGIGSIASLNHLFSTWKHSGATVLISYLKELEINVKSYDRPRHTSKPKTTAQFLENVLVKAIPVVQQLAREMIPANKAAKLPSNVLEMINLLEARIPPFQPPTRSQREVRKYKAWSFHEILTAGWLYQLSIGENVERNLGRDGLREYRNTCLLLLKALELQEAPKEVAAVANRNGNKKVASKPLFHPAVPEGKGVISGPSIRAALDRNDPARRLTLCPDLGDSPIESASRDLHLGHWFRLSKRTSLSHIDIAYSTGRAQARRFGQSELFVPPAGSFILQPGDFALATSLEYVCLPADMMAFVEGKSSLGRAGLLIATATQVAPGFKGCVVLELFNAGTVPVILRPAMRVAQLVLVSTDCDVPPEWLYSGEFQVQIKP
jgi:dCTP deaminase